MEYPTTLERTSAWANAARKDGYIEKMLLKVDNINNTVWFLGNLNRQLKDKIKPEFEAIECGMWCERCEENPGYASSLEAIRERLCVLDKHLQNEVDNLQNHLSSL